MRHTTVIALLALFFLPPSIHAEDHETTLKLPPASLAQWYKPANQRQAWLHTMFSLRREMQAVNEYLDMKDGPRLEKWAGKLTQHYRKIAEMVPEWRDRLALDQAERLQTAAQAGDFETVHQASKQLGKTCRSCHEDFRALAATLYRTPDFSDITVRAGDKEIGYDAAMKELTVQINRIKIAADDDRWPTATAALDTLRTQLDDLGSSCESCHQDKPPRQRILGADTLDTLSKLEQGLKDKDKKASGRYLGTAAVQVCARCHSVHRNLYDLQQVIQP